MMCLDSNFVGSENPIKMCLQVTSSFQDEYLIEAGDPLPTNCCLSYCLDTTDLSEEEGGIALNILPLASGTKAGILRSMAARFRLLTVCERALNSSLEGIDALLGRCGLWVWFHWFHARPLTGCPVVLPSNSELTKERLEDMELDKRQQVCESVFHTINWFKELVSILPLQGSKVTTCKGQRSPPARVKG